MSDLPEIRNGEKHEQMAYDRDAASHFQRMVRQRAGSRKIGVICAVSRVHGCGRFVWYLEDGCISVLFRVRPLS